MSYFIIPKINNIIAVNPTVEENTSRDPSIHLSHSLFNYYYILHKKIILKLIMLDGLNLIIQ